MGDIVETPENGESDPADNEQKETGGDGSEDQNADPAPDNNTSVIENPEQPETPSEATDNSENDQENDDADSTEGTDGNVSDETGTADDEDTDNEMSINDSSVNALTPSEYTVEAKEPDTAEGAEAGALKALSSAVITYTNGCVSKDGKLRKNADITFKLEPVAGKILNPADVKFKTQKGEDPAGAEQDVTNKNGVYTITKNKLMSGSDEKVNDVNVIIVVKTTDVKYTVKSDVTGATGYAVHQVTADKEDGDKLKTSATAMAADGVKVDYAQKDAEFNFVLKEPDNNTLKLRSVTVKAGDEEKTVEIKGKTADATPVDYYSFKPSDLGLKQNENQDITITVEATAAARITINGPTSEPDEAVDFGEVENATELDKYKPVGGNDVIAQGNVSGAAAEGQKVIFTATANPQYKALAAGDVTATFTATNGSPEPVTVTAVGEEKVTVSGTEKTVPAHYVIDLKAEGIAENGTLDIKATTTLDGEKDGVGTVDFSSVSENCIDIYAATDTSETTNLAGKKKVTETKSAYTFKAEAKPGWDIFHVVAEYDKVYTDKGEDGKDLAPITGYKQDLFVKANSVVDKENSTDDNTAYVAATGNLTSLSAAFGGTDADDVAEDEGYAGKAWTTKNVKIYVKANLLTFEDDKTVSFTSEYDYDVKTGDKITEEYEDYYTVKPGADFFEFTVDAVTEPVVSAKDDSNVELIGKPNKTDNGYVYTIPAAALGDNQSISIGRQKFDIKINYSSDSEITSEVTPVTVSGNSIDTDSGRQKTYANQSADKNYHFIISPRDNVKIEKVSYTVDAADGEEPKETSVTAKKSGSYVFDVALTGEVNVDVVTKNEAYDLFVMEDGEPVSPDKNKIYNVGHASTVTAYLKKGAETAELFNAAVKDGSADAATIARIGENNVVTLEFDASEYNKVLTVELIRADKTSQTFKVKTDAAAKEVAIAGVKQGKVELPVDTNANYKVTVKTRKADLKGLIAKVVPVEDAKQGDKDAVEAAEKAVSADLTNGVLTITAKPAIKGAADVAKVIIVDASGLNDDEIKKLTAADALKNGTVTVSTKDATITGQNPTVKFVAATDKEIKVQLGVPKGVVDPVEGKIYYKVELGVPASPSFPETVDAPQQEKIKAALTDAVKAWNEDNNNLYQSKTALDEKGGLLAIPVMKFKAEDIADGLDKGALLSGFSVKVTLLQSTDKGATYADLADAAKTITGGEASLEDLATKNPYYEMKLGLTKAKNATLITGHDKDVTVATPKFNNLTSFSTVNVEFVDTSTGRILSSKLSQGNYTSQYSGLKAGYDALTNAVIVNARGAYYYNFKSFKNLGIKVTAYAEEDAYRAVATQKLTIVNGIQSISVDVPEEIYKADDNKQVKFKPSLGLNGSEYPGSYEKGYAPKKKTVKWEIVPADYDEDAPESATPLSANIKNNVSINEKNGQVTIKGSYVVQPKDEDNQFAIIARAADYDGATEVSYPEIVTITDKGLGTKIGNIVVYRTDDDSYKPMPLEGNNKASITATKQSGEYAIGVLRKGTGLNKKSYTEDDYVDCNLMTFKSANAKSVKVGTDGSLTINKAAKNVKITIAPRDGSKLTANENTLILTVTQADKGAALRISRYADSTMQKKLDAYEVSESDQTINYTGSGANNYFKIEVVREKTEDDITYYDNFYLANYALSYSGGKQLSKKLNSYNDGEEVILLANAKDTTITLKDKAKNKTIKYKLTNDGFISAGKAPKITLNGKMNLIQDTGSRKLTYNVKPGKAGDDFTGRYVMLTAVRSNKDVGKNEAAIRRVFGNQLDKPLPIVTGQSFDLEVNTSDAGTYNLAATVGTLENGEFTPEYKDAKVTVKIAKSKTTLTAKGKCTISLKAGSGTYINCKSGNGKIYFTNNAVRGNYAKNAIINGQDNDFRDYFTVGIDSNGVWVKLRDDLPITDADAVKAGGSAETTPTLEKIVKDEYKNDRIGYISINNGTKYIDVKLEVTVKGFDADKTKYKVTATPVLDGPNAVTKLTVTQGKSRVYVAGMVAESDAGFKPVGDSYGNCYLEAANPGVKSHAVTLYIVPSTAPAKVLKILEDGTKTEVEETCMNYGVKTSVTVKVLDKTKEKNKITLANSKWVVADTDYDPPTGWSTYKAFTFKTSPSVAENTKLATLEKPTVNGKDVDYVTFTLPNEGKWMTSTGSNDSKVVNVPGNYYMGISLDKAKLKAAIESADNKALPNKKQLNWGKEITVKTQVIYGGDIIPDDLTFKIKLPGETDVNVGEELKKVEGKLQSDIETLTDWLVEANRIYTTGASTEQVNYVNTQINENVEWYIRNEVNKAIKGANVTVDVTKDGEGAGSADAAGGQQTASLSAVLADGNIAALSLDDLRFDEATVYAAGGEDSIATVSGNTTTTTVNVAKKWTVVVKSTATGTEKLYDHTFVITDPANVSAIQSAISGLTLGGNRVKIEDAEGNLILKVEATTKADDFAAAVRKSLGATATRNIVITAKIIGKPEAPTTAKGGSITFSLTVKDLTKNPNETSYEQDIYPNISYTIPKLDDLDTCKTKLDALKNATTLEEIIKQAWTDKHSSDDEFYAEVKDKIKAKANELLDNNEAITVDGFAQKAAPDTGDDFTFERPTTAAATSTISFKLHLKDTATPETDENRSDFVWSSGNTDITLSAMDVFQSDDELLTKIGTESIKIAYVETIDEAIPLIKIVVEGLSKNPAYDKSKITVAKTEDKTENGQNVEGSKLTPATEENVGTITKITIGVDGSAGTKKKEDVTVTIDKKPAATPAPAPEE